MTHGVWLVIALLAAGTIAIKAAGPVTLGHRPLPARVTRVIALLAPAILAGLVITETFTNTRPHQLAIDARAVGLVAAGAALSLRAPLSLVLIIAAAATALTRLA